MFHLTVPSLSVDDGQVQVPSTQTYTGRQFMDWMWLVKFFLPLFSEQEHTLSNRAPVFNGQFS